MSFNWLINNLLKIWAAGLSIFYLCNIDQFAFSAGFGPPPKFWTVGLFLVTASLSFFGHDILTPMKRPVVWWGIGYLIVSIMWMAVASDQVQAMDGLMQVLTTCLFIGMAAMIYPRINQNNRWWIIGLWISLCLGMLSIALEYFDPAAFVFADAGIGIQGRAAGFYLNPNIAAQAMVLIYACLLTCSPRLLLVPASMIALAGILFTLSRGGMVAWVALTVLASTRRLLPKWYLPLLLFGVLMAGLLATQIFDLISDWVPAWNRNVQERLEWILGMRDMTGGSAADRLNVASYAWAQYLNAPLLGHGLGSMGQVMGDQGSHNMILRHLVEYGLIGVLIFPSFIFTSIRSAKRGVNISWVGYVGIVVFLLSMFSHNMLEQGSFIFPWLAICLVRSQERSPDSLYHTSPIRRATV